MSTNIKPNVRYRTAVAERGKFWEVDDAYLSSIGYNPVSGNETGKYCILTYQVNTQPITLSGDVQLGAVELKDADSEFRVNVFPLDNSNAVVTMLVDQEGLQIDDIATETTSNSILTAFEGTDFSTETTLSGLKTEVENLHFTYATSGTPVEVADGAEVEVWYDTYGRQIIKGYNPTSDTIETTQTNQATLNRLGPVTNLGPGAALAGAGSAVDVSNFHNITFHIIATTVTVGAIITIQHSLDGTAGTWSNISSTNVTTDGVTEITLSNVAYRYVRTNITSIVDGSYTTKIYAGN